MTTSFGDCFKRVLLLRFQSVECEYIGVFCVTVDITRRRV